MPNLVKFKEDPDAMLVMSLEEYDEVTGKATKAAIMTKDVVGKTPPITQVASADHRNHFRASGAMYLLTPAPPGPPLSAAAAARPGVCTALK